MQSNESQNDKEIEEWIPTILTAVKKKSLKLKNQKIIIADKYELLIYDNSLFAGLLDDKNAVDDLKRACSDMNAFNQIYLMDDQRFLTLK